MKASVLSAVVLASVGHASAISLEERLLDPLFGHESNHELHLLAAALIIVGAALTFFGARVFLVTQVIFGFITAFHMGFYSFASLIGNDATLWSVCLAVGLIGGSVTYKFAKIAKAAVGLVSGAVVAYMGYITFLHFIPTGEHETALYVVVALAALLGMYLGIKAVTIMLVFMTAFVGAFGVVFGIDMVSEHQLTVSHVKHANLNEVGWTMVVCWGVLGCLGSWYQHFGFKRCEKAKEKACKKGSRLELVSPLLSSAPTPILTSLYAPSSTVKGRSGLYNLGNTCFMNASIQAMFAVPAVRQHFAESALGQSVLFTSPDSISDLFSGVLKQLSSGSSSSVCPKELKQILKTLSFNDGRQHDASEFLRALVNAMIEEMPENSPNPVKDIFGFETCGVVKCDDCGTQSVLKEDSIDLSLEIVSANTAVSVASLVANYFKPQRLQGADSYQCDKCDRLTNATRTSHLVSLPNNLILTLSRFRYSMAEMRKTKRMDTVIVSPTLTIATTTYSLNGMVIHSGSSADGGHYYAYTQLPVTTIGVEGSQYDTAVRQWYRFDDRSVRETDFDSIKQSCESLAQDSAYVLFYSKV